MGAATWASLDWSQSQFPRVSVSFMFMSSLAFTQTNRYYISTGVSPHIPYRISHLLVDVMTQPCMARSLPTTPW